MAIAIGIDLGTTNSVTGVRKLTTQILLNAEGEELTPSCVAFTRSGFVVGRHALNFLLAEPANTILSIKRLMGRSFADEKVQRLIDEKRYFYEICVLGTGTENSVAIRVNGKEYTPEFISAKILEKLKTDAEKYLKDRVEFAVVTVPAYFNDKQKDATKVAAEMAGLKVQRLLPEPTAAAIAFGIDEMQEGESKTILVYDFGGGTFDVSILTIANGHFLEQGKVGDMWLGGDDLDRLVENLIIKKAEQESGGKAIAELVKSMPIAQQYRFWGELKRKAEFAKIELSTKERVFVEILGLLRGNKREIVDIDVEISRSEFDALIEPMVARSIKLMNEALQEINFEKSLIDHVLLVGGCSSIPLVQERVREIFGKDKVLVHPRPMMAVAEGASILAQRLSNSTESSMGEIVHTTAHDYYLQLALGKQHLLVARNTILPHTVENTFHLVDKRQQFAHFRFSNLVNGSHEPIGDLWLTHEYYNIDEADGPLAVVLTFDIDENNLIRAEARLKKDPSIKIARTISRGKIDEKLFRNLELGIQMVNETDHDHFVAVDYMKSAISIATEINQIIDPKTHDVDQKQVEKINRKQSVIDSLAKDGKSTWGHIYYAKSLLDNYSFLLNQKNSEAINAAMISAEQAITRQESAKDITVALKRLAVALTEHSKFAGIIASIETAADKAIDVDAPKAYLLRSCLNRLFHCIKASDEASIKQILEEAWPLVDEIERKFNALKFQIHKDVSASVSS